MNGHRGLLRLFGVLALLATVFSLSSSAALAFDPRGGDIVVIGKDEVIDDDLYVAGSSVTIDGRVNGDLVAAGSNIQINGTVTGSVWAVGSSVSLRGDVGHSARLAGGSVSVEGRVKEDVMMAGGNLQLGRGADVGRDLVFGGGTATLAGSIIRSLKGGSGQATISGRVGGNAQIESDNLILAEGADIKGNLEYTGTADATIAAGAKVGGQTIHTARPPQTKREVSAGLEGLGVAWKVVTFIMLFVVGLAIVLAAPGRTRAIAQAVEKRTWHALGWGALLLFATPGVLIAVLITVIGVPLALIGLALYLIALYLTSIFIGVLLGMLILRLLKGGEGRWWLLLELFIGLIILAVLTNVPVLGFLVTLATLLFGLGAMWLGLIWQPLVEDSSQVKQ